MPPNSASAPNTVDPTMIAQSLRDGRPRPEQDPGRNDPTMLARSLGEDASPGQWPPHADPTMLARPVGAFDQPAPFGSPNWGPEPEGGGAVVLRHPTADRFAQQNYQWQPADGSGPHGAPPRQQYQPSYGPHGGSGGPPPYHRPRGSGRGKTLLLAGLVVLLVAGIAVGAVALTKRDSSDSAQGDSPALVSALTSTGSPAPATKTAPTTTTAGPSSGKTPLIPGFQVVAAPSNGAAYDVPAGWTIAPQETIGGFGHPPDTVAGKGYASEGKGYCPGSTRTVAFLTGSDTTDPARAATELGTKTAALAYQGTPGGTPGAIVPLTSLDGSQHGAFVETTGTVTEAKPGCATAYSIYTAAFPTDSGTFVMVIAADTGVPHALDAETAKRICTSIRPLEG
ncbi:hypothetical protein [Nocardia gipuzkoensis]|uniref:hypothetical protein n=1 Tax=Nocardia gipuzkoensis TaxID=2749991 RepID=UPI003EE38C4E